MLIEDLQKALPDALLDHHAFRGDMTLVVHIDHYEGVVDWCYARGFQQLVDLTAVDWPEREPRFEVVLHMLNLISQERLRLKVSVADGQAVPSLTGRFKCADWAEREVFDLFGIPFQGHPELKRLLLWDDYPGHPLRKDHPLDGGDVFCNDTGASFAGQARSLNA